MAARRCNGHCVGGSFPPLELYGRTPSWSWMGSPLVASYAAVMIFHDATRAFHYTKSRNELVEDFGKFHHQRGLLWLGDCPDPRLSCLHIGD